MMRFAPINALNEVYKSNFIISETEERTRMRFFEKSIAELATVLRPDDVEPCLIAILSDSLIGLRDIKYTPKYYYNYL